MWGQRWLEDRRFRRICSTFPPSGVGKRWGMPGFLRLRGVRTIRPRYRRVRGTFPPSGVGKRWGMPCFLRPRGVRTTRPREILALRATLALTLGRFPRWRRSAIVGPMAWLETFGTLMNLVLVLGASNLTAGALLKPFAERNTLAIGGEETVRAHDVLLRRFWRR